MGIYPPFGVTPFKGRVQRLEKGAQRQQRGQLRPTIGSYVRMPMSSLIAPGGSDNNLAPKQAVNLATSTVHKIGSTPPNSVSGNFAYVAPAAGTSIIWYWDGTNGSTQIVLHRSDGSNFTIPPQVPLTGTGVSVTGLTPSTDYYFLPYWSTSWKGNVGWVAGTTGVPQIAFVLADTQSTMANSYIMAQNQQNLEPLTGGFMSATTGTGTVPGGGNAGGGGSPGHCVMAGTRIETLGHLPYELEVTQDYDWVHLVAEGGMELNCTYDHPLYHADRGRIEAQDVMRGDYLITDSGEREVILASTIEQAANKYEVKMPKGHLFWANGFLSHNIKVQFPT